MATPPPLLPSSHVCKHRHKKKACFEWGPVAAQCLIASLVLILDELDNFFRAIVITKRSSIASEELDKAVNNLTSLSVFSEETLQTLLRIHSIIGILTVERQSRRCKFTILRKLNRVAAYP